MDAFLSHNGADKETARSLGAQLQIAGAGIWFDEWELRAGDSIPGKINDALGRVDCFIILWSETASSSNWVRAELEVGIQRGIDEDSLRVVPVIIDDTPLPPLLRPLRWVDLRDGDIANAVNGVMGFAGDRDRIRAIQETLEDAHIEVGYFYGYGAAVGCPRCGAGLDQLSGWHAVDDRRDDEYAGVRCEECGWEGGGEI